MKRTLVASAAVLTGLLLCSCGGGSSSNTSSNSPTPNASQPGPSGGGTGSGSGSGSGSGAGSSGSTAAIAYLSGTNNDFDGVRVDTNGNVSATSGSPYGTPWRVYGFAINNHLLLVASWPGSGAGTEASYSADQNGNLTALATTPLAADVTPFGISLDASGSYAYVGGNSGIYGYAVNRNTGALTPLPGSPFPASSAHGWVRPVVAPDGGRLCAEAPPIKTLASVVCFVRHSDGTLDTSTQGQNRPTKNTGYDAELAITPDSSYLIWTDDQAGTVNASPIGNNTGASAGSAPAGGQVPVGLALNGQWIAVANTQPNNIAIFTVNSSGQIARVGSPVNIASMLGGVAFSADGGYLFVSTNSGLLSYSFNKSTGALQPLNGGNATPGGIFSLTAE